MQIVFVHGFGRSVTDWSAQLEFFRDLADVVALELQEVKVCKKSIIVDMADRVNEVRMAAEAPPAILVGHSMGCRVVLEAARRLPDAVKGIVLIEGSLRATGDAREAVTRNLKRPVEENKALLMRDFAGMFSDATPADFRKSVMRRAAAIDSGYAVRLMADMTLWDAAEAPRALQSIRAPMLVLQSTSKDPGGGRRTIGSAETSPWLHLVAEQASDRVRIVRLVGLGHFPQVEAPRAINQAIANFVALVH